MQDSALGGRSGSGIAGIILGSVGALLDFYSGYLLISGPGMQAAMTGAAQSNAVGLIWGVGVSSLGVVVAASTIAVALPAWAHLRRDLGALMAVYGAAMLFFGGAMYLGATPMMQGGLLSGLGMLAVGALMLINSVSMRRSPMN